MTQRKALERKRHSLAEIGEIMNSMKTLAYMETRKLARFLGAQQACVRSIEQVAADLLDSHPEILPADSTSEHVVLVIGSERGFCGDFNQRVQQAAATSQPANSATAGLVVVGRKLHTLLEDDSRVAARVAGASTAEEIGSIVGQVVQELTTLHETRQHWSLHVICHGGEGRISTQQLLPAFSDAQLQAAHFPFPPVLQLAPRDFLLELTGQYLFAALHALLYSSLMEENRSRISHLEGAVKRIEEQSDGLARRCSALRQEEIIEEIEIILLNS